MDLLRRVVRDLLDVHAALGRERRRRRGWSRGRPAREIEFLVDRGAFLDVEPADLLARRPGLVRSPASCRASARRIGAPRRSNWRGARRPCRRPKAPEALAAPAGVDLRLDDPERAAELLGRGDRLVRREGRLAARTPARRTRAGPLWPGIRGCSWESKLEALGETARSGAIGRLKRRSSGQRRIDRLAGSDRACGPTRPTWRTSPFPPRPARFRRSARRRRRRSPRARRHRRRWTPYWPVRCAAQGSTRR